jgi:homoprotocatechuate degradation regulator HpaR
MLINYPARPSAMQRAVRTVHADPDAPTRGRRPLRRIDDSLAICLLRAREAVMNRFRPLLKRHDLTEQQWRVLRVLAEFGRCDAGSVAQSSCIHPASLSRILRTLDGRGLLITNTSMTDSRRVEVALTETGREVFAHVAPESEAIYRRIESEIGAGGLERALRSIRSLTTALK